MHSLDDTEALLDWSKIEARSFIHLTTLPLAGLATQQVLTLYRSLLLGIWYRLSDVQERSRRIVIYVP